MPNAFFARRTGALRATVIALVAAVALLAACSPQQDANAPAVQAAATSPTAQAKLSIDTEFYRKQLEAVSSDEMAGRGPGALGEKRFVPYLVQQLKELGLQPGRNGQYTQAVPMVETVGEISAPMTLSNSQGSTALKHLEDYVAGSRKLAAEVKIEDADMVFVGYGVVAPEAQWNDYEGIDVKGKVVVMLINDPGFHQNDATLFKGKAMTYYGRWTYKYEEAARQGAVGALIVHDDAGAAYGWDVVKNSFSGPSFDLESIAQANPVPIQGWLSESATRKLLSNNDIDLELIRAEAGKPGFRARPLKDKLSVAVSNRVRRGSSDNVLGVLPGTTRANELIIYTAHWDHLGQSFGLPDGIYNGAVDNGTGIAGLLELARAHTAAGPRERSIMFLFVTLEESGLLGSRYYAENPLYPLRDTVAVVNLDAMFVLGPTSDMMVVGYGNSELEPLFKSALKTQGRAMRPEAKPENGSFYRSDHFNFAKVGVPALYPKSGITLLQGGAEAGLAKSDAYTRNDYHKPSDQISPEWDFAGIGPDLEAVGGMTQALANSEAWPNWYQDSEFRALRDQQRPASSDAK